MFSPDPPREHHFLFQSPPARRLDPSAAHRFDEALIRLEMEERGLETPRRVTEREREKAARCLRQDMCAELLKLHGISASPDEPHAALEEKLELARSLRRRAELRRCGMRQPSEMPLVKLQMSLAAHRIEWRGLSHSRAARALELALLKDDAKGLVGDGYQFGRRVVSVHDIIAFENPSDAELRNMLKHKGVTDVPRKKEEKMEKILSLVESEQEFKLRCEVREEIIKEMTRRGVLLRGGQHPSSLSSVPLADSAAPAPSSSSSSSDLPVQQGEHGQVAVVDVVSADGSTVRKQPHDLEELFTVLYSSQKWREEYADVDHTEGIAREVERQDPTNRCVVS